MTTQDIIRIAQGEIGVTEYPANSNKVKYNTWYYNYAVYDGYKGTKYPWCVVFLEWLFKGTNLLKRTASASELGAWFKNNKCWSNTPQKGDIIFFNFHTPKKLADHVGIVESVNNDGSIVTIEGNTSTKSNDNGGAVMRRVRKTNIVGYGRPKYDNAEKITSGRATLSKGSKGDDVKYLHKLLKGYKYGVSENNNNFDALTEQCVTHFQIVNNLKVDGIVGEKTWSELEKKS